MVIHSLNSPKDNAQKERLIEILALRTKDQGVIDEAIDILEANGSQTYAH